MERTVHPRVMGPPVESFKCLGAGCPEGATVEVYVFHEHKDVVSYSGESYCDFHWRMMQDAIRNQPIRNPNLTARNYAYELMLGTSLTRHVTDLQKAVLALRAARDPIERSFVLRLVLHKRKLWLNWLTVTQRQWQNYTKNKNKARNHDSIEIRERYVRCN